MKYIMAEARMQGPNNTIRQKIPMVFPNQLVHSIAAQTFELLLLHHGYKDIKMVSAGTIQYFGTGSDGILCSGHSETLGLSALDEDAFVIETYDYTHGV